VREDARRDVEWRERERERVRERERENERQGKCESREGKKREARVRV